jgi:LPXTG-motif cell wall-anchored protein
LLAALAVHSPASALASSSPSAGDNQYTDPLATSPPTTTAPPTTTSSSPATTSSAQVTSHPAPTSTTVTLFGSATATTAGSASTGPAAASDPAPELPYTGDDVWLLAAAGAGIAGAGVVLRRRAGAR